MLNNQFTRYSTAEQATQWQYRAEGGGHLLLMKKENPNMILRIPKYHDCFGRTFNEQRIYANRNLGFISNMMGNWYGTHAISNSAIVELEQEFLSEVIMAVNPYRPSGRKKNPLQLASFGYLESNIFLFPSTQTTSLSWEIKIKSGLKSYSSFLSSKTVNKRFVNRFQLTQCYKEYITHCKGDRNTQLAWGQFQQISNYSPCDFCSLSLPRITHAFDALIAVPQNNLGIFYNGTLCYGWNILSSTDYQQSVQEFFTTFFPSKESDFIHKQQFLHQVLAKILWTERIAYQVELMQCFDFIDSEGSDYCYQRGLQYFPSVDDFHNYLLDILISPLDSSMTALATILHEVHHGSTNENHLSQWIKRLESLLLPQTISSLVHLYVQSRGTVTDDTRVDGNIATIVSFQEELCHQATSIIDLAPLEDLSLILKLWMIAAIAKDCSVVISLHSSNNIIGEIPFSIADMTSEKITVDPPTSPQELGCVYFSGYPEKVFRYQIHVIDIGLKDFRKFMSKKEKDEEICRAYDSLQRILKEEKQDLPG